MTRVTRQQSTADAEDGKVSAYWLTTRLTESHVGGRGVTGTPSFARRSVLVQVHLFTIYDSNNLFLAFQFVLLINKSKLHSNPCQGSLYGLSGKYRKVPTLKYR